MLFVLVAGCSTPTCADCCIGGGPTNIPLEVRCQVVRPDGGAAAGVEASCTQSDAGATTDATGTFAFQVNQLTCGFGAGSTDCGLVRLVEDGGALTMTMFGTDAGESQLFATRLSGGGCQVEAR